MPQIASNFILRSKLPNFERDSFYTLSEMVGVKSEWMDEGHISYCKEDNNHYIFYSDNGKLDGAARWTKLPTDESGTANIRVVQNEDNLNKELAEKIPVGALVYVVGNQQYYYNIYQKPENLVDNNVYFRPLKQSLGLDNYVIKTEFEALKNNIESKLDDIKEIKDNYITNDDLSNYVTREVLGNFEESTLVEHINDNYLEKNKLGDFDETKYNSLVDYIKTNYAPISEVVEREHVLNLVTKGDLENYVKKIDLPSLDNLATTDQLDNLVKYNKDTYTTKIEAEETYATKIDLENQSSELLQMIDEYNTSFSESLQTLDETVLSNIESIQNLESKDTELENKFDTTIQNLESKDTELENKFDNYYTKGYLDGIIEYTNTSIQNLESKDTELESKFDDYYTKEESNATIQNLESKDTELESKFDDYYTKEESNTAIQNLESKFDNQHKVLPQSEFDSIEDFSSYAEGTIFFTYKEDEQ